jgi:hypothetical protein
MRTTLDIPDHLFKRVKLRSVHESITLKQFLNRAIERELESPPKSAQPKSAAWTIPVAPHGLNDQKLSWNQIRDVLEEESDTQARRQLREPR